GARRMGAAHTVASWRRTNGTLVEGRGRPPPMMRTIALPAYNEAAYIAEMVGRALRAGEMCSDPFEVIVVDNASTDNTAKIVEEIASRDARVQLISHPENRLYAASCYTATKAAKGDRIFILDSNGQHPPEDIWKFDA